MAYATRTEVSVERSQAEIRKLIMGKGGTSYFLAHVQMPEGDTVGERIAPQLAISYSEGRSIPLLPAPKGGA